MAMFNSIQSFSLFLKLVSFVSSLKSFGRILYNSIEFQHQPCLEIPNLDPDCCLMAPLSVGWLTVKLKPGGHVAAVLVLYGK